MASSSRGLPGAGGGGGGGGQVSPSVAAFDAYCSTCLDPFVAACGTLGGGAEKAVSHLFCCVEIVGGEARGTLALCCRLLFCCLGDSPTRVRDGMMARCCLHCCVVIHVDRRSSTESWYFSYYDSLVPFFALVVISCFLAYMRSCASTGRSSMFCICALSRFVSGAFAAAPPSTTCALPFLWLPSIWGDS